MAKYTASDKAGLAAAGKRLRLNESDNEKISDIRGKRAKAANQPIHKNQMARRKETEGERLARMTAMYQLKPVMRTDLANDHDVTDPTRYQAVVMPEAGNIMLANILKRYAYAMKPQGISRSEFRLWREHFMLMSPEQLGALVRVDGRTIRAWESGALKIPFSMWWVMSVTMQDPEYFLTRPGFHDFYIEYENGEALFCSYSCPDIRWTATDLYFKCSAFNEVLFLREELKRAERKIQEMQNENTNLRQMFKTNSVSAELQAMHDHIGQLMQRINTADVMQFKSFSTQPDLPTSKAAS